MVHASYIKDDSWYDIVRIENVDKIETHFSKVESFIGSTSSEVYKAQMVISVEQGFAYEVLRDGKYCGHIYNKVDGKDYIGCSLFVDNDIVTTVILFKTIFDIHKAVRLKFIPHNVDGLRNFVSIVTGESIRRWHSFGKPVEVRRRAVCHKGKKLYDYLRIQECLM